LLLLLLLLLLAYYSFLAGFLAGYGPRPPTIGDPVTTFTLPTSFSLEVYVEVPNARSWR
jgi:hypothetical protein